MIIQGMNLVNFNVTNIDEPHLEIDYIVVAGGGGGANDGAGGGGYTYHTFTSPGTFTVTSIS